ncbi:hypothetical protein [Sodalis sp. RH22]|uniref:hypothetical protein n=1 Tax=unclassified Sodalis (in: enterobacteria) TaxID=2636512 RepID=UPI0039B49B23
MMEPLLSSPTLRQLTLLMTIFEASPAAALLPAPYYLKTHGQLMAVGGNVLDYDLLWTEPAKSRFHWALFATLRAADFRHVRVNLLAFAPMDTTDKLDPKNWIAMLDSVEREASAAYLDVIRNKHDFLPCGADAGMCRRTLLAFWARWRRTIVPHRPA